VSEAYSLGHYATSRNAEGSKPDEINDFFFSIYLILPAAIDPGVYSASDINDYQRQKRKMFVRSKTRSVPKANNLSDIC
jgi:hypothetical protein